MPIIGLVIGKQLSVLFNNKANLIGGSLLLMVGVYEIVSILKHREDRATKQTLRRWGSLLFSGLALSVDNLIIGFSLGTYNEPFFVSASVIGISSIVLVLVGLEIGNRLGKSIDKYSEIISAVILLLVGTAIILKIV